MYQPVQYYNIPNYNTLNYNTSNYNTITYTDVIWYSVLIAGSIIIIYCLWAYFIYRYNPDRIANLILIKYGAINNKQLNPDGSNYFNYDNVSVSADKTSCTCDMQIKDKTSQAVQSSVRVTYKLSTDDTKCTLLDALVKCVVI